MIATAADRTAEPRPRCGCCGQPREHLVELRETPGVFICRRCARWAMRQADRTPRQVEPDAVPEGSVVDRQALHDEMNAAYANFHQLLRGATRRRSSPTLGWYPVDQPATVVPHGVRLPGRAPAAATGAPLRTPSRRRQSALRRNPERDDPTIPRHQLPGIRRRRHCARPSSDRRAARAGPSPASTSTSTPSRKLPYTAPCTSRSAGTHSSKTS